jgi:hypothetical protein
LLHGSCPGGQDRFAAQNGGYAARLTFSAHFDLGRGQLVDPLGGRPTEHAVHGSVGSEYAMSLVQRQQVSQVNAVAAHGSPSLTGQDHLGP